MEIVRRSSFLVLALGLTCLWGIPSQAQADDPPPLPAAQSLLPQNTQGVVQVVNSPKMREQWGKTQLSKLAADESLKPFWDAQKDEIEKRLFDAGWQLNVNFEDLREVATGQVALGWVERANDLRKPYSLALIVDVQGKEKEAAALLAKVDNQLKTRQAKVTTENHAGQSIQHYVMPRKPGELLLQETFYTIVDRQLISTDDLPTMTGIIDARLGKAATGVLSGDATYQKSLDRLSKVDSPDIQYFVRPLGFAKVVRAIGGRREIGKTDIIAVLERQGYSDVQAVVGQIQFSGGSLDIIHRGFVLAAAERSESVQILDFPNSEGREIPAWVNPDSSSYLSVNWNAEDAFWKVEKLVDDMSGTEGVFRTVIDGMRDDPTGPQIDIEKDVIPYLTNEIIIASDTVDPITPDSRRVMVAVKLKDGDKIRTAVDNAMENEPEAEPVDVSGVRVWKVTNTEDGDADYNAPEFGDFGVPAPGQNNKAVAQNNGNGPLLENFSITVQGDYLLFASHLELIEEAIARLKSANVESSLQDQPEFQRTVKKLDELRDGKPVASWRVLQNSKSFRMQYELFRNDELPQSRSMWATLLDRILKPKEEVKVKEQRVKGNLLPAYDAVSKYLQPSGLAFSTQEDGWAYFSFLLAPETQEQTASATSIQR